MELINYLKNSIYANFIFQDRYLFFLEGLKVTIILSVLSFILGCGLGAIFCMAKRSRHGWIRKPVNFFTLLLVRLPALVLLLVFVYIIFAASTVTPVYIAVATFTCKTGAYLSSVFNAAFEGVDKGEIEAGRTLGMSKMQTFLKITLPQMITSCMPVVKNQFIITMQDTSVVGFIAIQDMSRATAIITSRTMDPYISLIVSAVVYLVIGAVANALLKLIEKRKHIIIAELAEEV